MTRLNRALALTAITLLALGSVPAMAQFGPTYYADVQLIDTRPNPDDVLPPGPPVGIKSRVKVDSGSPATFCNRADATNQGLLNPDGSNNPNLTNPNDPATPGDDSMQTFGGASGNNFTTWKSIGLSVNAGGLGRSTVRFKKVPEKMIFFPKNGGPPPRSLLGSDFISMLGDMSAVFRPDGSVTFYGTTASNTGGKKVGLILEPHPSPLVAGFRRIWTSDVLLEGTFGNGFSPFALVTGSPVTVISRELADQIGIAEEGEFFLDDELHSVLFVDGYINEDTQMLGLGTLPYMEIPTLDDTPIIAKNLTVLINRDSSDSLLGTNVFFVEGHQEVRLDLVEETMVFTHEITPDEDENVPPVEDLPRFKPRKLTDLP